MDQPQHLTSLEEFRRLRDWYGMRDLAARLPRLKIEAMAATQRRAALKAEIEGYKKRDERVPMHLQEEYNEAAWAWQWARGAYTLARQEYGRLRMKHPEWAREIEEHANA